MAVDQFELVNVSMDGKLAERLESMRDAGGSMVAIAEQLTADGYPVSRETVRRWLVRCGLPTKAAA